MTPRDYTRANLARKRSQFHPSFDVPGARDQESFRLTLYADRSRYPGWQFAVNRDFVLIAFRAHPETGALQRLGPWPLPADAGADEVHAACLAAVVETDGPDAAERFTWLPRK